MKKQLNILAALMICVLVPAIGFAQRGPDGPGGGGGRGGRGGGGGGGVAGLTSGLAAIADMQGELKASNEEWLVVGPLLQKLIVAQQAAEGIASNVAATGGGGRGGGGGNDTFGGPSSVATGGRGGGGGRGGRGAPGAPSGPGGGGGPGPNGPNGADPATGQPTNPPANSASPPAPAVADATLAVAQTEAPIQIITVAQALTDLQTALNEPSTPERQLKELLTVVRAARAKATDDLKRATEELQQALTTDQIALLVSYGYLQ